MGRVIDTADCRSDVFPTASTAEFLCAPNSCIDGPEPIPAPRNEEGESVSDSADGGQTNTTSRMPHEPAPGSRTHRGSAVVVDWSLMKVWCHLKSTFRTGNIPATRRQATNNRHAGSVDLDLISERRKFILDLANSNGGLISEDNTLSNDDLAVLNELHRKLIPASFRAARDMSQMVDSSSLSE